MNRLRWALAVELCLGIGTLPSGGAAAIPTVSPGPIQSYIVDAQVTCDYRGCFGYGPNQWYRRPTYPPPYLPPNNRGTYHRPAAVGVPKHPSARLVPPPPKPVPLPVQPRAIPARPLIGPSNHPR